MKNVYVIPSWYPTVKNPITGIFIKEQVAEFNNKMKDYNLIVGVRNDTHAGENPFRSFFRNTLLGSDTGTSNNTLHYYDYAFTLRNFPYIFNAKQRENRLHHRIWKRIHSDGESISLIHAHVAYQGGLVAYNLSKKVNVPYIITEHRLSFIEKMSRESAIFKIHDKVYRNAAKVCCVSTCQAEIIANKFNLDNLVVIPNFVSEEKFEIKAKKKETPFVFLTLCGLHLAKGIDTLLKAIAAWNPKNMDVKFEIGGAGRDEKYLKKLAKKLDVSKYVEWSGRIERSEVSEFFKNGNAFVLPSRTESFGVVYIEALATGLPIIATRCGGPEDIINNNNGIMVDVDNVEQLALALQKMYTHHKEYDSNKIRQDFLNRFSVNAVAKRYQDLYDGLIN